MSDFPKRTFINEPHPEVRRWTEGQIWPADKPFPLTPLEACYVLQGYCVETIGGFTTEQLLEMPGHIEGGGKGPDGWLVLWSA